MKVIFSCIIVKAFFVNKTIYLPKKRNGILPVSMAWEEVFGPLQFLGTLQAGTAAICNLKFSLSPNWEFLLTVVLSGNIFLILSNSIYRYGKTQFRSYIFYLENVFTNMKVIFSCICKSIFLQIKYTSIKKE